MVINNSRVRGVPAIDQPREKLIKSGIEKLSNRDIIALLLRSGVKDKNVLKLSAEILKKFTLNDLSRVNLDDLVSIPGIGTTRAASILAAFELNKRLSLEKKNMSPMLDTAEKVYNYTADLHNSRREKFLAIYLNSKLKVIKRCYISVGSVSASIVHPREVFKPAMEYNASSIIIVHNHPSGDITPSDDDAVITEKLISSGEIIGIPLLDHVIVTESGYYSFKEEERF